MLAGELREEWRRRVYGTVCYVQLWDDIMPSEKTDLKEGRCVIRLRFSLKSSRMLGCPPKGTKDLDLGSWC
jgi:hypothetical protein